MVIEFEGAEPVTFGAGNAIQVLWLPSNRSIRTPPASVVCETKWVAGLIVFMRKAGLYWTVTNDRVFLEGMDPQSWSPEHVCEYWRSVSSLFPGRIIEQRPFVGEISLSEASLNEVFHAFRIPDQDGDPH